MNLLYYFCCIRRFVSELCSDMEKVRALGREGTGDIAPNAKGKGTKSGNHQIGSRGEKRGG